MYVYQLFENGTVMSAVKIARMYKMDFVRHNGILKAMPKEWKVYFMTNNKGCFLPLAPSIYQKLVKKKITWPHTYIRN